MEKNLSFEKKNKVYFVEKNDNLSQSKIRSRIDWMVSQAKGFKVLDIGCSQGIISLLLAKKGFKVICADINLVSLGFTKNVFKKETTKVKNRFIGFLADFVNDKFQKKLFDTVIIGEVIEHLENPEKIISFAVKHTKENGKIVVTTPLSFFPHNDHKQVLSISNVIDLLPSNFLVSELKVENGFIYLTAVKKVNESFKTLINKSILKFTNNSNFIDQKYFYQILENQKEIINTLKEELVSKEEELNSSQNKKSNFKIEIDSKIEEIISSNSKRNNLKVEINSKKKEISSTKSKKINLKVEITCKNELLIDLTNENHYERELKEREIKDLKKKRNDLNNDLITKRNELIDLRNKNNDLKNDLITKRKELINLRNQNNYLIKDLKNKKEEIILSRIKINYLTEDLENKYEALVDTLLSYFDSGKNFLNKLLGKCSIESIPNSLCYILHNSLPYSSGGYATRSKGIADGFTKNGIINPILITRPGFPLSIQSAEIQDILLEEFLDGVKYRRIKSPIRERKDKRDNGYLIEAVLRLTEIFIEEHAQFIMAASNYYTSFPALIAARRLGLPFFYEVRGFWEINRLSEDPQFKYKDRYKQMLNMETYVAKNADHVFTLTKQMKNELIHRGVHKKQITLLPNSCDASRFYPRQPNQRLANKLNIPSNIPVIGYVGSFVQYEGLDMLLKAAVKLKNKGFEFRLLLVGSEDTTYNKAGSITDEIRRIAIDNNLSDHLIMTGRVSHEEVEEYYSLIDIAPFPRKSQLVTELVSPIKPLEALAMEKAVVVSSVGALREIVQDGITGLIFEKDNIDSLVEVLSRLISNPELRKNLGKSGRLWIKRERTWSQTASIAEKQFKSNSLSNYN